MKILFSQHALLQIKNRSLDKKNVLETIKNPDFVTQSYNFREERYRRFIKNHMKVVVIVEKAQTIVVTAHWVAKPKLKWYYWPMKINYDATVDALSVTLRKGKVDRTVEIAPEIMIDFDLNGRPLYLEILDASTKIGKSNMTSIQVGKENIQLAIG